MCVCFTETTFMSCVIHRLVCPPHPPTNTHTREQNRGGRQQSFLTIGPVFPSYLWVGRPSRGQKLIRSAPNVIMGVSHSISSLRLFGWMTIFYRSVLFLSCGFLETKPTLWMSKDWKDSNLRDTLRFTDSLWVSLTPPVLSVMSEIERFNTNPFFFFFERKWDSHPHVSFTFTWLTETTISVSVAQQPTENTMDLLRIKRQHVNMSESRSATNFDIFMNHNLSLSLIGASCLSCQC